MLESLLIFSRTGTSIRRKPGVEWLIPCLKARLLVQVLILTLKE